MGNHIIIQIYNYLGGIYIYHKKKKLAWLKKSLWLVFLEIKCSQKANFKKKSMKYKLNIPHPENLSTIQKLENKSTDNTAL